ncbi:3-phosphoglycerate dehydrogenase [Nonomuraea sp. NN258]|uniref:NAD(P)-dependent oxidoreductase n=1 Tax=Nonomuraea antri TaxID=2730852 RepID=UPI0015687E03|nr:NAD(P)-dependent oxidoreductase [Nonomuraea antri]NRQ30337.1 3-phosphoglycerate dehydrogenase [Nonomuraea antri]
MKRPRALVLPALPESALVRLGEVADLSEVHTRPSLGFTDDELADLVIETGANVLITDGDQVRTSVLSLPVDVVASMGAPTSVDLTLAAERGVTVLHAPDRDPEAVAELTLALMFAVSRNIVTADREVRRGRVYRGRVPPAQRHRGRRLSGRTVGIVGLGRVGRAMRWRCEGLGMRVIVCDPRVPEATHSLTALLSESDVVSLHVPLTEETRGFFGYAEFGAMRPGSVYLNTSRGALHDLTALVDALRWGRLGGAGLDHFEGEWLDPAHPLTRLPNVVLTPRLGEATGESREELAQALVADLARLLRGERPAYACVPAQRVADPA